MALKERINAVIKYAGLNPKAFANIIGANTAQSIYDLCSGKTRSLSEEMRNNIISVYPQISSSWLVLGEGEMIPSKADTNLQNVTGTQQAKGNHINQEIGDSTALEKLIIEFSAQRKDFNDRLHQSQQQIDRLLTLLENTQTK